MKHLITLVFCAGLGAGQALAADPVSFDQRGGQLPKISPQMTSESSSAKGGKAQWTVMVYINGKNYLEPYAVKNIKQMEMVGSTNKVKIAVELGRTGRYDPSDTDSMGLHRYIISRDKENNHNKIFSPPLQSIPLRDAENQPNPAADMGKAENLVDFVAWAKKAAPAQHYMLIVWNHGSGWLKNMHKQKDGDMATNGISYDEETGHHINTVDLGQALAQIGKLDIYASDACLMQMIEVDYQLKDSADYFVQSEETEPGDGYTYNTLLAPLVKNPSMSAAELATRAVNSYADHYDASREGATQSAVRASALPRLMALLNAWTAAILADKDRQAPRVQAARAEAQRFYVGDNKDLLDFVQRVGGFENPNETVRDLGYLIKEHISGEVVLANRPSGENYQHASGLAVYLPDRGYNADYDELAWTQSIPNWKDFLLWLNPPQNP